MIAFAAVLLLQVAAPLDDHAIETTLIGEGERLFKDGKGTPTEKLIEQLGRARCEAAAARPEGADLKPGELYRSCCESIVVVGGIYKCDNCPRTHTTVGAAFAVAEGDLFATNHHVLSNAKVSIYVAMTRAGAVVPIREVVAADKNRDAAIVRIPETGARPLALRTAAPEGTDVSIIGHPGNRYFSLTRGAISRYHRHGHDGVPALWMQTTADAAAGSSGGPVLDARGNVVGMIARTATLMSDNEGKKQVQMVVKDCVPAQAIVDLLTPPVR